MANTFQKVIYFLSAASPIGLVFSIVLFVQKNYIVLPIVLSVVSVLLIFGFLCSFKYARRNIASMTVRVTDVATSDLWIIGYIVSYLLPLANMVIDEWNLWVLAGVALLFVGVITLVNDAMPHPILLIIGYHFYKITTENGISSYVMISKKKIRHKKDIKCVGRVFEFLLIEK